jgi:hypothetical protein
MKDDDMPELVNADDNVDNDVDDNVDEDVDDDLPELKTSDDDLMEPVDKVDSKPPEIKFNVKAPFVKMCIRKGIIPKNGGMTLTKEIMDKLENRIRQKSGSSSPLRKRARVSIESTLKTKELKQPVDQKSVEPKSQPLPKPPVRRSSFCKGFVSLVLLVTVFFFWYNLADYSQHHGHQNFMPS